MTSMTELPKAEIESPPAKILIVDDDERNLLALREVLDSIADVVTASSGRQALRELLKHEFAVILLDVFMPDMDGYETATLIRQRQQTSGVPIIFVSAVNKETEHLMRGYQMGAVDYVFKPVEPLVLRSKVSVFVDLFNMRRRIEEQGRAEAALRDAHFQSELERLEMEAKLVQAGKMDALGQLTGGVAHDFNNLLAAMLGGIHVLARRVKFGDREKLVVDQMRHAAEQGVELVRRMMAFARKQELTPTSVEPSRLCETVAGLMSHTLGGIVTVDWHCPETRLNLFVDRSQLELAMVNLLLNARDAMPHGGVIDVSIEQCPPLDERSADFLRIRIRDHGQGIPAELIEKVTDPFFTTKPSGKGTGLGLSMVAGFVKQSGGELRIDSTINEGSTIDLILPATPPVPADAPPEPVDIASGRFRGKMLLLIDDDEAVRLVLSEQLRDLDLIVEAFDSGARAVDAVRANGGGFDFVLSDFAMPGINGLETLRALGTLLPNAGRALMTGFADEDVLAEAAREVSVIKKPVNLDQVAAFMARYCES
jgi:signal transduction histidine kinase